MNAPRLQKVIRLDSLPYSQTYFTEEGYLRDSPIVTRTGIFEYVNPDGSIRRELRLPEEVFKPESLASYKGKPICITHDAGLINKENVHENQIGTILSDGRKSGEENVAVDIIIHDTGSMKDCKMKELSLGYDLDLDETPGVWHGQPYDAIQRNILINHLALVREARAGEKARLNIDGRGKKNTLEGGKTMNNDTKKEARTDGILSAEELEQAIAEYKASRAAAEKPAEEPAPPADAGQKPAEPVKDEAGVEPKEEKPAEAAPAVPAVPAAPAPAPEGEKSVEKKVEEVKNSDAEADKKVEMLCNIIDSLLAEREFKAAAADGKNCADCDPEMDSNDAPVPSAEEGERKDDDNEPIPDTEPGDKKVSDTMNTDSIDAIISAKIRAGMVGRSLNLDALETVPLADAKKQIIKAVRPAMNLDGKSDAFIDAAYEFACTEAANTRKDTTYQMRQMFNGNTRADSAKEEGSANKHRDQMIAKQQKKKEDK